MPYRRRSVRVRRRPRRLVGRRGFRRIIKRLRRVRSKRIGYRW